MYDRMVASSTAPTLAVAVGMPIARHPPHRPVLALLAHTVPTLDVLGVKTRIWVRVQGLNFRHQVAEAL